MSNRGLGVHAASAVALACLASIALAQGDLKSTIESANCYQGVRFDTVHGTVTVILPTELTVGSTVSGTVLANPKGKTEKEKAENRTLLAAIPLLVMGTKVQGTAGQFTSRVPNSPTVGIAKGNELLGTQQLATIPSTSAFQGMSPRVPRVAQVGQLIPVLGSFDGDASNSSVAFGPGPGVVFTESPNSMTVMPVNAGPGPCNLVIKDGSKTYATQTNLIGIRLQLPKNAIMRGERLRMDCEVSGLSGLTEQDFPLSVLLRNLSPSTVQMQGGNSQTRPILLKDVSKSGSVIWSMSLVGLIEGNFTIEGSLNSPNFPWPGYYPSDVDRPIAMDGDETATELDGYTIRRLMDTLRDLRARKWYDLMHGRENQAFLKKCLKKIKAALERKGVTVPPDAIDDSD
jgi:hypothetical protein